MLVGVTETEMVQPLSDSVSCSCTVSHKKSALSRSAAPGRPNHKQSRPSPNDSIGSRKSKFENLGSFPDGPHINGVTDEYWVPHFRNFRVIWFMALLWGK